MDGRPRSALRRAQGSPSLHLNPVKATARPRNPSSRSPQITPAQTLSILRYMIENVLHFTLVFVVAATALRCSEVLSLRWADILWEERKIRIVKSWKKTGVDGDTKTQSSERNAPMGRVLMHYLLEWRTQTPYGRPTDLVFPSLQKEWQGSDLRRILPHSLATSSDESRGCHP